MRTLILREERAIAEFKGRVLSSMAEAIVSFTLFGSRSRMEGNEESDVDILILLRKDSSLIKDRIFEIAADIFLDFEIDISPLVMSKDHFEDMRCRERRLPVEIVRDGRTL